MPSDRCPSPPTDAVGATPYLGIDEPKSEATTVDQRAPLEQVFTPGQNRIALRYVLLLCDRRGVPLLNYCGAARDPLAPRDMAVRTGRFWVSEGRVKPGSTPALRGTLPLRDTQEEDG